MGYDTHFYGRLEFTRRLTEEELGRLERIIGAGRYEGDPQIEAAVESQAESNRRPGGPLIFDPDDGCGLRARIRGYVVGEDSSPHYADALRISDDGRGLEYCSEKTYDLVAGVNFIIANARLWIPKFGLKGSLFADTEFEPYEWLLKINDQGWAEQVACDFETLPLADQRLIEAGRERERRAWEEVCRRLDAQDGLLKRIWRKLHL